ncbi:bifunctional chorismate mutase/prephenate dehydrogenase [Testudinibacter aquarius]|uniref:T-protein n=1 Tax=Testudinibacter aquarius TaxID=1524974 RepID=A0A4R3Y7K9_9PAST|nr:bifunctional chorismate mutase/prephenate dehydrogenase [Testudinibacter aquarius]KAE9530291.1 bifunctional chorismate mutase/prephenate dehydrogenase [Testudinibacter aquarius]TCV87857.1 chorismate mutase [Testudinibacter aquarius]TNG88724.1 bifunctional chorismate mutase/prephenate dehydrogenase [Testudinibacter aquarius]
MQPLQPLRDEIDKVDRELLGLLEKRLSLVAEVGQVKHQHGLPVYAPEREAEMLAARRQEAEKMGISPDLIEDLLRRIMRESYQNEHKNGFKTVNPAIKKIVIVGGKGKLGGLFGRYFQLSGYQVENLGRTDWQRADQILYDADVVIVTVPIRNTLETIERLQPHLRENMLLLDFTSVKRQPVEKMLQVHQGAVLGLHPMFGPDIASFAKQLIVRCDGRYPERYQWILQQMQLWGATVYAIDPAEHDKNMTYIQALRHFATFANGLHLSRQPVELSKLLALSSPIYRLELAMIGRLFAQDGELYADIILDKPENLAVIESLKQSYEEALCFFEQNDRAGFTQAFKQVSDWFGNYSEVFMKESRQLLQQANDYKQF